MTGTGSSYGGRLLWMSRIVRTLPVRLLGSVWLQGKRRQNLPAKDRFGEMRCVNECWALQARRSVATFSNRNRRDCTSSERPLIARSSPVLRMAVFAASRPSGKAQRTTGECPNCLMLCGDRTSAKHNSRTSQPARKKWTRRLAAVCTVRPQYRTGRSNCDRQVPWHRLQRCASVCF